MPWAQEKMDICAAFNTGYELLKSEENSLVNKFSGENRVECLNTSVTYTDKARVKTTFFAVSVMVDTRIFNAEEVQPGDMIGSYNFNQSQPVLIGMEGTMDAQVYTINAGTLLIPNLAKGNKNQTVSLFTREFFKMWDECYKNAGGNITGFGTNPWQKFFKDAREEVNIPVYLNICACRKDTHFAVSQRTYNHDAIVLTVTSGRQFSIVYVPANSTSIKDTATGVWAKHGSNINVCALKVTASNEEYSVEGIEATNEQIADDSGTSSKGLFPFMGNTTFKGCYVMTVTFPVHKRPPPSITRGGGATMM